jgi:hypothetical protein
VRFVWTAYYASVPLVARAMDYGAAVTSTLQSTILDPSARLVLTAAAVVHAGLEWSILHCMLTPTTAQTRRPARQVLTDISLASQVHAVQHLTAH